MVGGTEVRTVRTHSVYMFFRLGLRGMRSLGCNMESRQVFPFIRSPYYFLGGFGLRDCEPTAPKPPLASKAIAWRVALDPMGQGHLSKEAIKGLRKVCVGGSEPLCAYTCNPRTLGISTP